MTWGVSENVSEEYFLTKLYLDEMERYKRESDFIVSKFQKLNYGIQLFFMHSVFGFR